VINNSSELKGKERKYRSRKRLREERISINKEERIDVAYMQIFLGLGY